MYINHSVVRHFYSNNTVSSTKFYCHYLPTSYELTAEVIILNVFSKTILCKGVSKEEGSYYLPLITTCRQLTVVYSLSHGLKLNNCYGDDIH